VPKRLEDYQDDPNIRDPERLIRRVPPWLIVMDKNLGGYRASSQHFRTPLLSVYLEGHLQPNGLILADTVDGHEGYSAVAMTAEVARRERQKVVHEPNEEPPRHRCDRAHGLVVGIKPSKVGRRLAKASPMIRLGDLSQARIEG